jgi:hypothetical protein
MTDWNTVRFDPAWEEKIDPEILPLCDALNAAGIETIGSCAGHGCWPYVLITGKIPDSRIESLARHLLTYRGWCCVKYVPVVSKIIELVGSVQAPCGHYWSIELHLSETYKDTPLSTVWDMNAQMFAFVTREIGVWK